MAETTKNKRKALFVDHDEKYLNSLASKFADTYETGKATSAQAAMEILQGGFKPDVIVCEHEIAGMPGADFLEKCSFDYPESMRILGTLRNNPKELTALLKKSSAFFCLNKPYKEFELSHTISVAIEHKDFKYKTTSKDSASSAADSADAQAVLPQAIQALAGFGTTNERFYFTNHANSVSVIAKTIAERMKLDKDKIALLSLSAHFINLLSIGMPMKFRYFDPFDLPEDETKKYFLYFNKNVGFISRLKPLFRHANILSQIWEHFDNSGLPRRLAGNNILQEAQILAISNIYHNFVYRVPYELKEVLKTEGQITQTPEETQHKHEECLKMLYKRMNWFDFDLLQLFQDMAKKRHCYLLIPESKPLVVYSSEVDDSAKLLEMHEMMRVKREEEKLQVNLNSSEPVMIDKEISISSLKAGMTMAQDVVTKKGMLIVRQYTQLDATLVKKIKSLEATGIIDGYITISVSSTEG